MARISVYRREEDPSYGGMCPECHEVYGYVRNGHCPRCKHRLMSQAMQEKIVNQMLKKYESMSPNMQKRVLDTLQK